MAPGAHHGGLSVLLSQLEQAVAFVDPAGLILLTNRPDELPVQEGLVAMRDLGPAFTMFRPNGRAYETAEWPVLRAAASGEVIVDEHFYRLAADGSQHNFSCDASPFFDEHGAIAGAVIVTRDLTEQVSSRKEFARELRAAVRRADDILENVSDSFFAVDSDWRFTYLNQRAVAQFSDALGRTVTRDDLVGQNCWETFPEWAGSAVSRTYERAAQEQRTLHFEFQVARNGRWLEARVYPSAEGVATYLTDITERVGTAQRMEEVRGRERRRIARELHDDGLRELSDALGIAAIARITSTDAPEEQRWGALSVSLERLGQHLRSAIYDLRLDTHEDRPFATLLEELMTAQAGLAGQAVVQLHGEASLPAGSVGYPGTEILRIIREAITNARRHSGARTIRVDTGRSTRTDLRVEVADDGHWPDREAELASGRGTGITGMRERADELGAQLRIEAIPGGGTRVSVWLPLRARERD